MTHKILKIFTAAVVILLWGCGGSSSSVPRDAVARVGKTYLAAADVAAHVPAGLGASDSAAFARAYINNWLERRLILRVASEEVDIENINRLVEEYRADLIMTEYRRRMADNAVGDFAIDSLQAYYQAHIADFKLDRPMVKGLYVKIDSAYAQIQTLANLMRSDRADDMDRLDNMASANALHYDNFKQRWVDWEQIETRIPGVADTPEAGRFAQYNSGGYSYLLSITEIMAAGSPMPFEAAVPMVRERLLNSRRRSYDAALRRDLVQTALAEGKAQLYGADAQ